MRSGNELIVRQEGGWENKKGGVFTLSERDAYVFLVERAEKRVRVGEKKNRKKDSLNVCSVD